MDLLIPLWTFLLLGFSIRFRVHRFTDSLGLLIVVILSSILPQKVFQWRYKELQAKDSK